MALIQKAAIAAVVVFRIDSAKQIVLGVHGQLAMMRGLAVLVILKPVACVEQRLAQVHVSGEHAMKVIPLIPMKTMIQGRAMFLWTPTAIVITII